MFHDFAIIIKKYYVCIVKNIKLMQVKQLTEVIQHFSAYLEAHPEGDMEGFAFWLLKQKNEIQNIEQQQLHRDLGYYIHRIHRYGKYLSKQFLEPTAISSLDEFSFLTSIHILNQPTKSEVYEATITELATGQQMMRRLIKSGFVEEIVDEKDKRKKRLILTEKGKQTQQLAFKKIGQECNLKFEGLDINSKQTLLTILKQLDQHLHTLI